MEKRGLTTLEAVARMARALGVQARDVGYAGMKDRNATTRQWLSLPAVEPSLAAAVELDGLRCSKRAVTATSCAWDTCAATASR
jgi:tRNA pseudouridine13 synthase